MAGSLVSPSHPLRRIERIIKGAAETGTPLELYHPRDGLDTPGTGGEGGAAADFLGQPWRGNAHVTAADPDAQQYHTRMGPTAKLSYLRRIPGNSRHVLAMDVELTGTNGRAERSVAASILERSVRRHSACGYWHPARHVPPRSVSIEPVSQHDRNSRPQPTGYALRNRACIRRATYQPGPP